MRSTSELHQVFVYLSGLVNLKQLTEDTKFLREQTNKPDFWNDQKEAIRVSEELKRKEDLLSRLNHIKDTFQLIEEFALQESELDTLLVELDTLIEELELELQFDGEFDNNPALIEIHPGAGGTESQDWAEMLLRMYVRFAERNNFKLTVLDRIDGDEAGLKSVSIEIDGKHAYGLLKGEKGVHRLVRISPFDSNKRRHTSFASVLVTPVISDSTILEIPTKDLRVDTYRSQGAGGQNVNKVESAVRITHIPTGLVAASQTERSQPLNKEIALRSLRSKLYELEQKKKEERINGIVGGKSTIEWGSQIRSYVFCPYTMVKDHRSSHEEGDVHKIMDGSLEGFIKSYLKYIKGGK